MLPEQNKAVVRRYLDEVWNKGNLTVIDELIAPDYLQHTRNVPPGREGVKQFFRLMRTAFSNVAYQVDDMVAEEDKVVWRWTITGIHSGTFQDITATGKPFIITGINIVRMENGQLSENWGEQDNLGLLQQLRGTSS
jgi:steroid delta-isomerase-like uncharacterized protein